MWGKLCTLISKASNTVHPALTKCGFSTLRGISLLSPLFQVLVYFLTNFKAYNAALIAGSSQEDTGDILAYAMKLIIIPLLSRSYELQQHEVVGATAVATMVNDMFDPIEEVQGKQPTGCYNTWSMTCLTPLKKCKVNNTQAAVAVRPHQELPCQPICLFILDWERIWCGKTDHFLVFFKVSDNLVFQVSNNGVRKS